MKPLSRRLKPFFLASTALILWSAAQMGFAAATPESIDSVKKAIVYLQEQYADQYPGANGFLERLESIDPKAETAPATLDALRHEALSAHPVLQKSPIVFVVRQQYRPDHHNTGTMFLTDEVNAGSFRGGGAIKTLDLAEGGKVETVFESPKGVARDLEVSYEGDRLLFSMRRGRNENYHVFEINADGQKLRQLTHEPSVADIDPVYLPDGRIIFSSTRDPKYCGCNQHIQSNLFLMNADGSNIRQVGRNNLFEARASILPDGRVIYDRWEYVDRHYGPSFGLWTMMPDGRNHALYYGNNAWSPGAIFDARALPGTDKMVAVFGSCHDRPRGAMVVLDRRKGLDGETPLVRTWPESLKKYMVNKKTTYQGRQKAHPHEPLIDQFKKISNKYEDPWPLDEKFILCARMTGQGEQTGIFLVDFFGNEVLLHTETPGCFDPMPLTSRVKPPVLTDGVDLTKKTGTFYVADVYRGSGMENVPRGSIKTIRVVEAPPKRHWTHPLWRSDTLQRPAVNFNCTNNKRILGDAPVEEDGSAYFEVPAERFVFFQALDENGMMVQSMRSGTTLQPGERAGCVGCHEPRLESVETISSHRMPIAMTRAPSKLKPWHGPERNFNYLTEIQPVFDRHCVGCHDYGKEGEKGINLCGDLGIVFNVSYLELRQKSPLRWYPDKPDMTKALIKAVDDGPPEVLPPYAWGAHRSRLIDMLRAGHNDVKLSEEELDRLITWIDLNASYYGTYESNYPNHLFGRCPLSDAQLSRLSKLTGAPIQSRGLANPNSGKLINFTRPKKSLCLEKLDPHEPDYREALSIIEAGRKILELRTRADMSNFKLVNPVDLTRKARLERSQHRHRTACRATAKGKRCFERPQEPTVQKKQEAGLRWIRPTAVVSASGSTFPKESRPDGQSNPKYAAEKAIDGNPDTFTCLLDDTPTGSGKKTIPPQGSAPVTGHLVVDLGRPYLVTGLKLRSRKGQGFFGPSKGDLFCYTDLDPAAHPVADDLENDDRIDRVMSKEHQFCRLTGDATETILFEGVVTRYVGIRVNDSYESTGGKHFNFQIAELAVLGREPSESMKLGDRLSIPELAALTQEPLYQKAKTPAQTMLGFRQKLHAFTKQDRSHLIEVTSETTSALVSDFWKRLRADFPSECHPWLDEIHHDWFDPTNGWFAMANRPEFERRYLRTLLDRWKSDKAAGDERDSAIGAPFFAKLHAALELLESSSTSADDPAWLTLCARAGEASRLCRQLDSTQKAIDHLAQNYPGRFDAATFNETTQKLTRAALDLLDISNAPSEKSSFVAIKSQIEKLQHESLVKKNPLLAGQDLLFAKRHAYCGGWYYADFMRVKKYGGNLCRLSIDTGEVTELVSGLDGGVFDRFDLSFDGKRIVFGYKEAAAKGFRLYEVGVDGKNLRQVTFDPADEPQRIEKYLHPRYGRNGCFHHTTDDFHPCYLPDGGIAFASTRCELGVLCGQDDSLVVNTLYRVDADGKNLHQLSQGALSESTPVVTDDGRILYTRWEYVDKGVIAVQSLWSMWPDGSGSVERYGGQQIYPPVLIHARQMPGDPNRLVSTLTMHHPFAVGPLALIDVRKRLDTVEPVELLTPDTNLALGKEKKFERFSHWKNGRWVPDHRGPLFADPYPLTDVDSPHRETPFFLVTCNPDRPWYDNKSYGLYLIDTFGNRVKIYDDPTISCWQPIPLAPRPTPPVLPVVEERNHSLDTVSVDATVSDEKKKLPAPSSDEATVVLSDIYAGLEGVKRGTVKYLRVWEQIGRPWAARRFWPNDEALGQQAIISKNAHIYLKRLWGIVPVAEDGSAHFTVPADRNIFFQAVDENFMEIQRMRSFVDFQPGETRACVGCHLSAHWAPSNEPVKALEKPAARPVAQPGETVPRTVHYETDVQPIFDHHCVSCHGGEKPDGKLDLSGTLTKFFNRSYEQIMDGNQIAYIQEFIGPDPNAEMKNTETLPPYALGSHASRLVQELRKGHHDVVLSPQEWIRLTTWVDANGPYYGTYFGRRNLKYRDHGDFRPVPGKPLYEEARSTSSEPSPKPVSEKKS